MVCFTALLFTSGLDAAASTTAPAGPPPIAAEQRAQDDALQRLIDQVLDTPLATGQTVTSLLAGTVEGQLALRQAIVAEYQQGPARVLADDTLEVEAWISRTSLADALNAIIRAHVVDSSGQAPALSDAAGPVIVVTGRYRPGNDRCDVRLGWRHCAARQIDLAAAAARIDLHARLLDRIARLRVSGPRMLRELMIEHPRFHDAVSRRIDALVPAEPTFEPTGVCRCSLTVPRGDIIQLLARSASESGDNLGVDLARITDPAFEDPLNVAGFAVAPPIAPPSVASVGTTDAARPEWADEFITATATYKAPADAGDEQTRRALAASAARIEAARQLWMRIEALPLPQGGTIGTLLATNADAADALGTVDQAMFPTSALVFGANGTATITLGVRLQVVWQAVRNPSPSR